MVFHLAAQADVRVSVARPAFDAEVNVIGSLNVLEGARVGGTRKVVFASSGGTIYGEPAPADLPVKESHPQQPLSPYGVAKRVVTDYLHVYRELHSIEFTSLAMANIYGPRQDPHGEAGVVAIFAGLLLAGKPCTIFGDGEQTRDFVYVDDAVDAFVRAADRGSGLLCNIGTGVETSVNELYDAMAAAAGVDAPAVHAPGAAGRAGPQRPRPGPGRAPPRLGALDRPPHRRRRGPPRIGHGCGLRELRGLGPPVLVWPGRESNPDDPFGSANFKSAESASSATGGGAKDDRKVDHRRLEQPDGVSSHVSLGRTLMIPRGVNGRGRCAPNSGHRDVWAPARHSRARWSSQAAARGHADAALRYCRYYRRDRARARVP